VEDLKSYEDGIERFSITNIMLPASPFFSTSIIPVLNQNITTITSLELVNCNLKAGDIELVSKFIKKNKVLGVLNLSKNKLFGKGDCVSANQLSKAMKKHPELSYVNLSKTSLGINNEALKIILEGSKGINSLIIDDNALDKDGIALVTNFLQKKNAVTEFSMGSNSIGEGEDGKANVKLLRDTLQKNTTLEQLCLGSNLLRSNDRIFSTVMSGIKGSVSLTHIDLSGNEIKLTPSAKLIAKYLARNPVLVELNLDSNGMSSRSANVLAKALKKNTTLQHLSLKNNNITDNCVPSFTDLLQNNNTLRSVDLKQNNINIQKGRKDLLKLLCDPTSLDSIVNNSNHICSLIIAGRNYGGTYEEELNNINRLKNDGEKIRYKVVLALCVLNKDLFDPRSFDDIPLELMPNILDLVQKEIGYNGYGKEITRKNLKEKESTINRLNNIYETIHQWPAFPSLFARGPGKGCLTKTGKLKRKREKIKPKLTDEDEDFVPNGFRKTKRKRWQRDPVQQRWRYMPDPGPAPSRSSSRSTATVSYADVENSEDES